MKAGFIASAVLATGLAGCATDYVPQPPPAEPGPQYHTSEVPNYRGPGMFGDLTWKVDLGGKKQPASAPQQSAAPASAAEQEEFKKWQESAGRSERQEFEDWRAWREWKKQNPK